mmetsp:Transcript_88444/g.239743  ORF Transcript_88444/g.239743 Transcript_88444/m.239743 type:complete len:209 (-) Transcript_88444:20-646(-)
MLLTPRYSSVRAGIEGSTAPMAFTPSPMSLPCKISTLKAGSEGSTAAMAWPPTSPRALLSRTRCCRAVSEGNAAASASPPAGPISQSLMFSLSRRAHRRRQPPRPAASSGLRGPFIPSKASSVTLPNCTRLIRRKICFTVSRSEPFVKVLPSMSRSNSSGPTGHFLPAALAPAPCPRSATALHFATCRCTFLICSVEHRSYVVQPDWS